MLVTFIICIDFFMQFIRVTATHSYHLKQNSLD